MLWGLAKQHRYSGFACMHTQAATYTRETTQAQLLNKGRRLSYTAFFYWLGFFSTGAS